MSFHRHPASITIVLAAMAAIAGCTSTGAAPSAADGMARFDGVVASIDTTPWTFDGNAVIEIDSVARGRVAVQLPARWNLCAAAPVDVQALSVGMRVQVVADATAEGGLVVCGDPSHRLAPVR